MLFRSTSSDIDNNDLEIWFNTTANDLNKTKDPSTLQGLTDGGSVYVKANKAAKVGDITLVANTWTSVSIPKASNVYPSLKFTFEPKNQTVLASFTQIPLPDVVPPVIKLSSTMLQVEKGATNLEELLLKNATITDNKTKNIVPTLSGVPNTANIGVSTVTYTATDEAGNVSTARCTVKVVAPVPVIFKVGGITVEPKGTLIVDVKSHTVTVESKTGQPYSVAYKPGVKTSAQMKIGSNKQGYLETTQKSYTFDKLAVGYNTVLITMQDRQEYVFYIYVQQ